ncbi:MAG: ABC transporter ATP-binding protein [Gammaproteobacteria bacterium]|jgi:heme exporter protein A|tara:strand:+ start:3177 stop:3764 length:588 start_codon:yes stop_codon:yes gene_type:complete
MQLITASNLGYSINQNRLFHNLTFSLETGCGLHIKGGNGSGKSTLIRILLGLTSPSKGEVVFSKPSLNISYLGHKNAIKQHLTPLQNLELIFSPSDLGDAMTWMQTFGLTKVQDEMTATLSFGQQKKLALIRVLGKPSDLIILDEPFVGLDDLSRDLVSQFLCSRLLDGTGLVLTSHIDPVIPCVELILADQTDD